MQIPCLRLYGLGGSGRKAEKKAWLKILNELKMGSSFSIQNDTDEAYWVNHYNCQAALWGSVGGVLILTGVGGFAGAGATAAATAGASGGNFRKK